MYFKELINKFLEYKKRRVKISTFEIYKILGNIFLKYFDDIDINNFTTLSIQNFLDDIVNIYTKKYCQFLFITLKMILNFAIKFNYLESKKVNINVLELITKQKNYNELIEEKEKTDKIYNLNELTELLNEAKIFNEDRFIYIFGLFTGMRIGEILALTWQDIDFTKREININKNLLTRLNIIDIPKTKQSIRKIYIFDDLLNELLKYRQIQNQNKFKCGNKYFKYFDDDNKEINFIFRNKTGKLITYNALRSSLKKIKKIDVNFHFHKLRHSFASICIQNNINVFYLSKILGHANINTTQNIYTHIQDNLTNEALKKISFQ